MNKVQHLQSGLIYRNPAPHVHSRHAYFPSVILMGNGEMLASFAIGEAFEATNLQTYIVRSADEGETWSEPVLLLPAEFTDGYSNCARLTALPDGEVVALVVRHDRTEHLHEGLANPENLGFVPTEILLLRSRDYGRSWSAPEVVEPPLVGPSFELCSPVVPLYDGRWIWPTSTWRGWDGYEPNGMKMVAFVSHDRGKTWPEYLDVMNDAGGTRIYWESKVIELSGGAMLAVAWVYDEGSAEDLVNHYSISRDGGRSWLQPLSTGLQGQTMAIMELPCGRILSVYRRTDVVGLWTNVSRLNGDVWVNESSAPLWGVREASLFDKSSDNIVHGFNELKFGAPCLLALPDGTLFVAFWCYEKLVSNIRWFKVIVS